MKSIRLFVVIAATLSCLLQLGCGSSSSGVTGGPRPAEKTASIKEAASFTSGQLGQLKQIFGISNQFEGKCGAKLYTVSYMTTDWKSSPRKISGLIILPTGVDRAPISSYQHGTTTHRLAVPSNIQGHIEAKLLAMTFGNACHVVLATDYIGLGPDSTDLHPYLHAETEATAAADLIVAGLTFLKQSGVQWNQQLFLLGYSQGGHATMALHRHLEANPALGLTVTASAPMAGPYDLSGTSVRESFRNPSGSTSLYAGYILMAMNHIYGIYPNLSMAVRLPYAETMKSLYDGTQTNEQVAKALPPNPRDLFLDQFYEDVTGTAPTPFRLALKKNDLYDWVPRASVRLYHGTADKDVPAENSRLTAALMRSRGADVTFVDLGPLDHQAAFLPAMVSAFQWFESIQKRP